MGRYDTKKHPFIGKPVEKSDQIKSEPLLLRNTIKGSRGIFPWDLIRDDSNSPSPVGNIPNSNKKRTDKLLPDEKVVLKCLLVRVVSESEHPVY